MATNPTWGCGQKNPIDLRISLIFISTETTMKNQLSPSIIEKIAEQLAELKFGELTVVVHDGKVVQIEVKEKIRLSK